MIIDISLVTVPYWWDITMSTLKNQIYNVRPDLFNYNKPDGRAIPDQPKRRELSQSMSFYLLKTNKNEIKKK